MAICKSRDNLQKHALQFVALADENDVAGFEKNEETSLKL